MLSALAARRARQAAIAVSAAPTSEKAAVITDASSSSAEPDTKKPTPATRQQPNSKGKKRRKSDSSIESRRKPLKNARYFAQELGNDSPSQENDLISDEDGDGDASLVSDGDDAVETITPIVVQDQKSKRDWSPSRPYQNTSGDESDNIPINGGNKVPGPTFPPSSSNNHILSTFRPILRQNIFPLSVDELLHLKFDISDASEAAVLSIPLDQTLCIFGVCTLAVLRGSISLQGTRLRPSRIFHRVFAPKSAPLPIIKSLGEDGEVIEGLNFDGNLLLQDALQTKGALVIIRALSTGIENIGQICRVFDGAFTKTFSITQSLHVPGICSIVEQSRDIAPFEIMEAWDGALGTIDSLMGSIDQPISSPPILMVKGLKKSGKSTFARMLTNRLLERYPAVAFLETDLGQSEFTPAGMVALNIVHSPIFGPPFTHLDVPHRAHYIGATSPRPSPSHYLGAIDDLVQSYRLDIQYAELESGYERDASYNDGIPLVVNTMGWTKGLGADLVWKIQEMVEPTHIFDFQDQALPMWSTSAQNGSEGSFSASQTISLPPIQPSVLASLYTAADHRNISLLSYFHNVPSLRPSRTAGSLSWKMNIPLCAMCPYEVNPRLAFDRAFLTGTGMEDVVPEELNTVLNGAIVGLVECDMGSLTSAEDDGENTTASANTIIPYQQSAVPPSPSTSSCLGLALIRGISKDEFNMHILTPIAPSSLGAARVLVKGEMELPVWGMLDFRDPEGAVAGVEQDRVPFLRWGRGEGAGGERRRIRRNLMRKAQG